MDARKTARGLSRRTWILALGAALIGSPRVFPQLIETVDYSDSFTVAEHGGAPERADGTYNTGSPAYDVEDAHGNPVATWTPASNFSFNTGLGSACCGYPTNEGNDGAATGLAQSGGGDFSFAYGLRTDYVVELDAILPLDRLDISSVPSPGAGIFSSPSLSVFLRADSVAGTPHAAFPLTGLPGIGLYNGSLETAVTDPGGDLVRIGVDDAKWHRFAVHFNQDEGYLRVFVDGRMVTRIDLETFAGGLYRSFSNAAVGAGGDGYDFSRRVLWVDNFAVGGPSSPETAACFTATPRTGPAPLAVDFDAACSFIAQAPATYAWDFGDGGTGSGEKVQHVYGVSGSYQATLTVTDAGGKASTATAAIAVYGAVQALSDGFDRADGPPSGWTVYAGSWNISGGELVVGPTGAEHWIWAGEPPVIAPIEATYSFKMRFLGPGTEPAVGRHAGFVFCANRPTHRYDSAFTGYFVDWIDRADDRGLRLTRVDNGTLVEVVRGQASGVPVPDDVPLEWVVEVDAERIRLSCDGVDAIDFVDPTYRGGFFGFWTWLGGQEVAFDDFSLNGETLSARFTAKPPLLPVAGSPVSFDASGSKSLGAPISSYEWSFGDGSTGSGVHVQHAYAEPGDYTVRLTVRAGDASAEAERLLTVTESLAPFADCFDEGSGPVEGWTPVLGEWAVNDEGEVETTTAEAEAFLYAGNPPKGLPSEFVAEVDWRLVEGTNPDIGRHAAVSFFWNVPTADRFAADSRGYTVFFIDRAADRGLSLLRFTGTGYAVLNPPGGTPDLTEPPSNVRIEVSGPTIRIYADEVLKIEVEDETYRDGYFALWAYSQNRVAFDDVLLGATELPECGVVEPEVRFVRGDTNADGSVNLTDAVFLLNYLFLGGPQPPCMDAADVDDNGGGQANITDAIRVLNWLFLGGLEPPPPSPSQTGYGIGDCGIDPTKEGDSIECASFPPCKR